MKSDFREPVNIGSEGMVSINQLVDKVSAVANKSVERRHKLDGPVGVRRRNSDNGLI
jgi:nucleoside-diphosphate-sugar epimerase